MSTIFLLRTYVRDPERVFGYVLGCRQDREALADRMSANQQVGGAFHVLEIFGGFRRKREAEAGSGTRYFG